MFSWLLTRTKKNRRQYTHTCINVDRRNIPNFIFWRDFDVMSTDFNAFSLLICILFSHIVRLTHIIYIYCRCSLSISYTLNTKILCIHNNLIEFSYRVVFYFHPPSHFQTIYAHLSLAVSVCGLSPETLAYSLVLTHLRCLHTWKILKNLQV